MDRGPGVEGYGQQSGDRCHPKCVSSGNVAAHRPGIDGVPAPGLLCELNPVIGENGVDLIGLGLKHMLKVVFMSAVETSWATANLDVRSIADTA